MPDFRRLGQVLYGPHRHRNFGGGQHPGFRFQDFLTFEAGTTTPRPTAWDAVETGGAGAVAVNAAAAYRGSFGFAATVAGAADVANGRLNTPNSDKEATLSYLINRNTLAMGAFESFRGAIFIDNGPAAVPRAMEVQVREVGGGQIDLQATYFTNAGATVALTRAELTPGWHKVDLYWKASDVGQTNGIYVFYFDGVLIDRADNISNSDYRIDGVQLGAREAVDAGTSGTMWFDDVGYATNIKRI